MTIEPSRHRIRRARGQAAHRPSRSLASLAAAGVVAAGLVVGAGGAPAEASTSNASYFVNAINAQRVAHHRAKLRVSAVMTGAAQRWASSMAHSNQLAHNPKLASSVGNWRYLGENVGLGYSASSLEAAFYASPHHRANMLDSDFTEIGVAVVVVNGKMWVAEEFRRPMHQTTHKTVSLRVGSRGSLVAAVQRLLHITSDGIYGPQTKSAVANFQRHHHLKATGRVGPKTLAALKH
jgi:uncharacterized protein YkwD